MDVLTAAVTAVETGGNAALVVIAWAILRHEKRLTILETLLSVDGRGNA